MVGRVFLGIMALALVAAGAIWLIDDTNSTSTEFTAQRSLSTPVPTVWPASLSPVPACDVTVPTGGTPPGESAPLANTYTENGQWVGLYPDGTILLLRDQVGSILPNGSLGIKFWWWRPEKGGKREITGRRLDAPAPLLGSDVPGGYDGQYFQATGLSFPTQGCWEVTGRVGDSKLSFTTLVLVQP